VVEVERDDDDDKPIARKAITRRRDADNEDDPQLRRRGNDEDEDTPSRGLFDTTLNEIRRQRRDNDKKPRRTFASRYDKTDA